MTADRPPPEKDGSGTDAEIVARVRRGNADAFELLVRRHLRAAHARAFAVLGQDCDADDACQEAFITALERIEQCRNPDHFRAWILAIVHKAALGIVRDAKRRKATPLDDVPLHDRGPAPDTSAFWSEAQSDVGGVLSTLTYLQRRVLILHDFEGWRHREIAEQLGISPGSSRVHLHGARRSMRTALGHRYSEGLT